MIIIFLLSLFLFGCEEEKLNFDSNKMEQSQRFNDLDPNFDEFGLPKSDGE